MKNRNAKSELIRNFILESIFRDEKRITKITADKFGISTQAVNMHVKKLIENGLLEESGFKKGKTYKLKILVNKTFSFKITKELEEHVIWRDYLDKLMANFPRNIYDICSYGISEMVNNAIEHSEGNNLFVTIVIDAINIEIRVIDDGIGIFNKIQRELKLEDPQYAVLELAKGKLTTDSKKHSGEGIFFTSRVFDSFSIFSDKLTFNYEDGQKDWLLETEDSGIHGTTIIMNMLIISPRTITEVYDRYSTTDEWGFNKTYVPVRLLQFGNENLVSRSQARRLLVRFDKFKEIVLDFKGVNIIGNAFIDEIFRVFKMQYPDINIDPINANDNVMKIIKGIVLTE